MKRHVVLVGLAALGFLAIASAVGIMERRHEGLPAGAAEPAIIALAAMHGWRVIEAADGRSLPERRGGAAKGKLLVLVGPTAVDVRGFYCAGGWCDEPIRAQEAVELWLLPGGASDGDVASPQAYRVPSLVHDSHRLRVYGLVSRWWPGNSFDENFTDASTEASSLGPIAGDLPVSWPNWAADVNSALVGRGP